MVSVVNGVSRDGRVDGVGPRHGNLDSPIVERLYGAVTGDQEFMIIIL